jgi:hypothetical protein
MLNSRLSPFDPQLQKNDSGADRSSRGAAYAQINHEDKISSIVVQNNILQMLPDLECFANGGLQMRLNTNLSSVTDTRQNVICCLPDVIDSTKTDYEFSLLQHLNFKCQNIDEFLLPNLNELQGARPSSIACQQQFSSFYKEQAFMAARGIIGVQPKSSENQAQQAWYAELNRAFDTLSAFEIVDHGLIEEE